MELETGEDGGSSAGRVRVKIKRWHGVARWKWTVEDEECGICRCAFDAFCPRCNRPGDGCAPVWGVCNHAFHLHCITKWAEARESEVLCPMCRREWDFRVAGVGAPFPCWASQQFARSTHRAQWLRPEAAEAALAGAADSGGAGPSTAQRVAELVDRAFELVRVLPQFLYPNRRTEEGHERVGATAAVLLQRVLFLKGVDAYAPQLLLPAVVMVASKAEETAVTAASVDQAMRSLYGDEAAAPVRDFLRLEFEVLKVLGFSLLVFHPHSIVPELLWSRFADSVRALPTERVQMLSRTAWRLVNDAYRTACVLAFPPRVTAVAAVVVASELLDVDIRAALARPDPAAPLDDVLRAAVLILHRIQTTSENVPSSTEG